MPDTGLAVRWHISNLFVRITTSRWTHMFTPTISTRWTSRAYIVYLTTTSCFQVTAEIPSGTALVLSHWLGARTLRCHYKRQKRCAPELRIVSTSIGSVLSSVDEIKEAPRDGRDAAIRVALL